MGVRIASLCSSLISSRLVGAVTGVCVSLLNLASELIAMAMTITVAAIWRRTIEVYTHRCLLIFFSSLFVSCCSFSRWLRSFPAGLSFTFASYMCSLLISQTTYLGDYSSLGRKVQLSVGCRSSRVGVFFLEIGLI